MVSRSYRYGGAIKYFDGDVNGQNYDLYNIKELRTQKIIASEILLDEQIGVKYSGKVISLPFGETIQSPALVVLRSDGKCYKANISLQNDNPFGMALEYGEAGEHHKILIMGVYQNPAEFMFSPGDQLYLGETNGSIVSTPPLGFEQRLIGMALTNTKIAFFFGKRLLESDEIADYSITTTKIATGAITTEKIAEGAIDDTKIINMNYNKLSNIPTTFFPAAHGNDVHSIHYEPEIAPKAADNPKNHDRYTDIEARSAVVDDSVYNASEWDGISNKSASKNAIRDKIEQIVNQILNLETLMQGVLVLQGNWDCSSDQYPATPSAGQYWICSVPNVSQMPDGQTYDVHDWLIYNGTDWNKLDARDAVLSIDGQTGHVNLSLVYEAKFSKNTAFNKDFGTQADQVASGNHLHSNATPSTSGFLSDTDKAKLDTITPNANLYTDEQARNAVVDDSPYNATLWDNQTNNAPSKNTVRDEFEHIKSLIPSSESLPIFYAIEQSGNIDVSNGWTDISFDTQQQKTAEFQFTSGQAEIIILTAGKYEISYYVGTQDVAGTSRSDSEARIVEDIGGGYNEIPGSIGLMYNRTANYGYNSCSVSIIRDFAANTKIKLQVQRMNGSSTITTYPNAVGIVIKDATRTGPPGEPGPAGADGDLTWEGEWSSTISYLPNQIIQFDGASYVCVQANINTPPPSPEWNLVVAKGSPGPAGQIYCGKFLIISSGPLSITGLGFKPVQIKFHAMAHIISENMDQSGSTNQNTLDCFHGVCQGFAREEGTVIQQTIFNGASANSVNAASYYSSTSHCVGIRYADVNGALIGKTTAIFVSFDIDGFTVNCDAFAENLLVLFTAYG